MKIFFKIAFLLMIFFSIFMAGEMLFGAAGQCAEEEISQDADATAEKTIEDLIQSGKLYYSQKKYQAAIQQWEEALNLDPQNKKIKKYIENANKRLEKQIERKRLEKEKLEKRRIREEQKEAQKDVRLINITAPPPELASVSTLDDCINIAIKNSLPLQVAEKNIKLGGMRILEARRNMLPSASITYSEYTGRVTARRYFGRKQYIEGQQPIFHGGELYSIMRQAEINLEIVKKDYDRIKNDLILQVKKGYYTLAKAKENMIIQDALSKEVERTFEMVNKAFEAGVISRSELLNVTSQTSQVRFQLISAEGDEAVAELILKQAMNIDLKEHIEIKPKLELEKFDVDFSKVLNAAFTYRPEFTINSLMTDYYKYEVNIAKAKGWPKVDLMGNWGLAKEEFMSEDLNGDSDQKLSQQWYAGVKVSVPFWGSTAEYSWTREQWVPVVSAFQGTEADTNTVKFNIFDNLKYYSDRQDAEISFTRARQELNKIKQDITLEVKEGCFNYEKALIQVEVASNKMAYQENDVEVRKLRRSMDEIADSDVIESMIRLSQEKFGYVQAMVDCYLSIASLNKAVGKEDYFKIEEDIVESDKK